MSETKETPTTDQLRGMIGPQLDCPIPGTHFEDGKPRIHLWASDALAVLEYLQERDSLKAQLDYITPRHASLCDQRNSLSAELAALRVEIEKAIVRLDDWQFPNSKPIVEDIADDLRAALSRAK